MSAGWILILFAHVGPVCSGNSNALTSVPGFLTEAACKVAGKQSAELTLGTCKEIRFICVKDR